MRRYRALLALLVLATMPTLAQIETAPGGNQPIPIPPPAAQARAPEPPPVLPVNPQRRALEAVAQGGSDGMSYSGPAGAMNTSPFGASCAVVCTQQPPEQYQISCSAGFTAICQCDTVPFAGCRKQ